MSKKTGTSIKLSGIKKKEEGLFKTELKEEPIIKNHKGDNSVMVPIIPPPLPIQEKIKDASGRMIRAEDLKGKIILAGDGNYYQSIGELGKYQWSLILK
tara:strand:- start:128 stop:424 length:297 start_codon:yes stop_codon:yes gene_type:complete